MIKFVPKECEELNDVSRFGSREPCEVGAWVHLRPKPSVCAKCVQKNKSEGKKT